MYWFVFNLQRKKSSFYTCQVKLEDRKLQVAPLLRSFALENWYFAYFPVAPIAPINLPSEFAPPSLVITPTRLKVELISNSNRRWQGLDLRAEATTFLWILGELAVEHVTPPKWWESSVQGDLSVTMPPASGCSYVLWGLGKTWSYMGKNEFQTTEILVSSSGKQRFWLGDTRIQSVSQKPVNSLGEFLLPAV